jgi:CBS-domain-containing membrane protein
MAMKVTEIMSRPVITVAPDTPIKEAARLLVEHSISALPVLDGKRSLVGIVSEADLVPLETRPDPRSQATPMAPTAGSVPRTVADVMTSHVISVRADTEVSQAARTMLEADVKRVPVLRGRRVIGIVSRRDLVRVIARRDDSQRSELEQRLAEAGIVVSAGAITVESGVAAIAMEDDGMARRLAESVALSVPGVLEVRFVAPAATAGEGGAVTRASSRSRKL